jgi:hypothetical protein
MRTFTQLLAVVILIAAVAAVLAVVAVADSGTFHLFFCESMNLLK